jgi:hypothetical protein
MNDEGGTVRQWIVRVAVLVILLFYVGFTLHMWQQAGFMLDLHNLHA